MSSISAEFRANILIKKENLKKAREWHDKARKSGDAREWDEAAIYYDAAEEYSSAIACRIKAADCRGVE